MQLTGQSFGRHEDGGHGVEAEQRKVGEVVAGEGFTLEMGVDQAKAAQSRLACSGATDVWQDQATGLADHHPLDLAFSAQEYAELAPSLERKLGEVTRQLAADQFTRADAAAKGRPQSMQLRLLEAEGVAE